MDNQIGFTLIEVLVAVVILALGLLGLAGLQATGLANNQSAYNRSQVVQLAYDLADRMRSNPNLAGSYVFGVLNAVCRTNDVPCTACTTTGTACSQTEIARKDLFEWNRALVATVPGGFGRVAVDATNTMYTVTINWIDSADDKRIYTANTNFAMSFRVD